MRRRNLSLLRLPQQYLSIAGRFNVSMTLWSSLFYSLRRARPFFVRRRNFSKCSAGKYISSNLFVYCRIADSSQPSTPHPTLIYTCTPCAADSVFGPRIHGSFYFYATSRLYTRTHSFCRWPPLLCHMDMKTTSAIALAIAQSVFHTIGALP